MRNCRFYQRMHYFCLIRFIAGPKTFFTYCCRSLHLSSEFVSSELPQIITPSAPRLAIVLTVFSVSFCADKFSGSILIFSRRLEKIERTHLTKKVIPVILIFEPVIGKNLLFAGTLLRHSQRLRHSALHEAHPIHLLDLLP